MNIKNRLDSILGNFFMAALCCLTFSRPSSLNEHETGVRLLWFCSMVLFGHTIQFFVYEWFSWWYVFIYVSFILFLFIKDNIATARYQKEKAIEKERKSLWQPYNGEKYFGKVNIELLDGQMIWNVDGSELETHSGRIKKWMPKSVIR